MSKDEDEQPQAFVDLLSATKTRKGEFAQAVAELIEGGAEFAVPNYLQGAIYRISEAHEDTRAVVS
jgi:putative ATP-dependent endonuclease of the OLD family